MDKCHMPIQNYNKKMQPKFKFYSFSLSSKQQVIEIRMKYCFFYIQFIRTCQDKMGIVMDTLCAPVIMKTATISAKQDDIAPHSLCEICKFT